MGLNINSSRWIHSSHYHIVAKAISDAAKESTRWLKFPNTKYLSTCINLGSGDFIIVDSEGDPLEVSVIYELFPELTKISEESPPKEEVVMLRKRLPRPLCPASIGYPGDPFTSKQLEDRIDNICGCNGNWDCDCVSVFGRARMELWTLHNGGTEAELIENRRDRYG